MRMIRPRLRVPAVMIIAGSAIAAAIVVSRGWARAIPLEVVVITIAFGYYAWGGSDTDSGALVGSRPDERQASLQLKVMALQARVMAWVAIIGYVIAIAVRASAWPFELFAVVGAVTGLAGLMIYRDGHPGRAPWPGRRARRASSGQRLI
jgi:hypothetical protein